jgi:hypothetical protein
MVMKKTLRRRWLWPSPLKAVPQKTVVSQLRPVRKRVPAKMPASQGFSD